MNKTRVLAVMLSLSVAGAHAAPLGDLEIWTEFQANPSDGTNDTFYGTAAVVRGQSALIGAFGDSSHRGAAYVLQKFGAGWNETQKLVADDGHSGEEFGYDAAMTANLIAVTAWNATVDSNTAQGAAYLFKKNGNAGWTQFQKIVADDGGVFDNFGQSIATDGSMIVVGANGAASGGQSSVGAAYVYKESGGSWVQQQKLGPDDGASFDSFGQSVAISGDTIFVGSSGASVGSHAREGAIYVFDFDGAGWTQTQKLVAGTGEGGTNDMLGMALSVEGDTLVAGAPGGSVAYVFSRDADTGEWTETQQLSGEDTTSIDNFGDAVSISGDRVLVAADVATVDGDTSRGAAYLFQRVVDTWTQEHKFIASDGSTDDFFGSSAAFDGSTVLLTSPSHNAGYFYTRETIFADGFDG